MNPVGWLAAGFLIIVGAVMGIVAFVKFIVGLIKDDQAMCKSAGIILLIYIVIVAIVIAFFVITTSITNANMDKIPILQTHDNAVTILREFHGSVPRDISYWISDESKIEQSDYVSYGSTRYEKCGYSFEVLAPGKVYIASFYNGTGGMPAECDVYEITIDDEFAVGATMLEHIQKDNLEELKVYLKSEYNFAVE